MMMQHQTARLSAEKKAAQRQMRRAYEALGCFWFGSDDAHSPPGTARTDDPRPLSTQLRATAAELARLADHLDQLSAAGRPARE